MLQLDTKVKVIDSGEVKIFAAKKVCMFSGARILAVILPVPRRTIEIQLWNSKEVSLILTLN